MTTKNWYPECPICEKCMVGAGWDFNLWHSKRAYNLITKYEMSGYLTEDEANTAREHVRCAIDVDKKTALEFSRIEELEVNRAVERIRSKYADR